MRRTIAMLMAGGLGSRLSVLAIPRAKPAVPFGGYYRIIDFTLSNAANAGLANIGILTQYKPLSLMNHIGTGAPWDWIGRTHRAEILPPRTGEKDSDWYKGTADAVAQNLDFMKNFAPERVLILSGDHIYWMDYAQMVRFHKEKAADLTIAMMQVPWEDTLHFGIAITDKDQRIVEWEEKPAKARSNFASMGIYVFNAEFLYYALEQRAGHDFGKNIIPWAVTSARTYAYPFEGYWRDVGTVRAYFEANRDLLPTRRLIDPERWNVRTNWAEPGHKGDRCPAYFGESARVIDSVISPGCIIQGEVVGSILSPGVRVEAGAVVHSSVVMHNVLIGRDALLDHVVADKQVVVGQGANVGVGEAKGPNQDHPDHVFTGLTVLGKGCQVPAGSQIGRNCIIFPWVRAEDYPGQTLDCGETVKAS